MGDSYFYSSKYPIDGGDALNQGYGATFSTGSFGAPSDARTANQIKAVSDRLNTGAKTIEVSEGVMHETLESIPLQHFDEINRLKKITGVDLTFHGPIIEPTGVTKNGWDPTHREQAERQMFSAVQRAHRVDPDGNVIVTFHSSAVNFPTEVKEFVGRDKDGKIIENIKEVGVVNELDGSFNVVRAKKDYLTDKVPDAMREIDELNKENWTKSLAHTSFQIHNGMSSVEHAKELYESANQEEQKRITDALDMYKKSSSDEWQNFVKSLEPNERRIANRIVNDSSYGDIYIRDAYNELQKHFNQAWFVAKKSNNSEDLERLKKIKEDLSEKSNYYGNPLKLSEFAEAIQNGINTLGTLKEAPKLFKPFREFAVEKSGETFGNIAYKSYKEFRESAPIISIENPPAGTGLSTAQELKEVIESARKKFVENAEKDGLSQEEARRQAEKLIGATWDVGHINMIKKYGYGDTELKEETRKVAPYVKHVHLSDNFGMEHTELPMGMGNVPMKEHIAELQKGYKGKIEKLKYIIETGNWYQPFKSFPLSETFAAFGASPIYGMKMAPQWNRVQGVSGGYFAGYGTMLPETHFSTYGSGFSMLPTELGGQMSGRNRFSGSPVE